MSMVAIVSIISMVSIVSIISMVAIHSILASALLSFQSAAQRLFCGLQLFSCQKFGGMK